MPFSVWLPWASYFTSGIAFHGCAEVPAYPRAMRSGLPLADAAQVEITLDEWDRLRDRRLVKTGHATEGSSELERNEGFVVVVD